MLIKQKGIVGIMNKSTFLESLRIRKLFKKKSKYVYKFISKLKMY